MRRERPDPSEVRQGSSSQDDGKTCLPRKNCRAEKFVFLSALVFYSQARKIHSPQRGKAKFDCEKMRRERPDPSEVRQGSSSQDDGIDSFYLKVFDVAFGGAFKVFFHKRLLFIECVLAFAQRDFDLDKRVLKIKF